MQIPQSRRLNELLFTRIQEYNVRTFRRGAVVTAIAAGTAGPRQRTLHGGEHVVQAVGDDDVVINRHYYRHHNHGNTNT